MPPHRSVVGNPLWRLQRVAQPMPAITPSLPWEETTAPFCEWANALLVPTTVRVASSRAMTHVRCRARVVRIKGLRRSVESGNGVARERVPLCRVLSCIQARG